MYNCNGLVSVTRSFPNPHNLEAHIECYGRQVRYLGNFPLQRTPRLLLH